MRASLSRSVSASAEGLHEEAREHRLVALHAAVGGGDDDAPLAGQARQERRAGRRRVDEDDLAADRRHQRLPVGRLEVGPDQVELGVDAVEGGVADEDDEQQVVLLEHRREAGERGADLVARRHVDVVADRALRLALGDDVAEHADVVRPASASSSRNAVAELVAPGAVLGGVLGAAGRAGDDDGVALRGAAPARRRRGRRTRGSGRPRTASSIVAPTGAAGSIRRRGRASSPSSSHGECHSSRASGGAAAAAAACAAATRPGSWPISRSATRRPPVPRASRSRTPSLRRGSAHSRSTPPTSVHSCASPTGAPSRRASTSTRSRPG